MIAERVKTSHAEDGAAYSHFRAACSHFRAAYSHFRVGGNPACMYAHLRGRDLRFLSMTVVHF